MLGKPCPRLMAPLAMAKGVKMPQTSFSPYFAARAAGGGIECKDDDESGAAIGKHSLSTGILRVRQCNSCCARYRIELTNAHPINKTINETLIENQLRLSVQIDPHCSLLMKIMINSPIHRRVLHPHIQPPLHCRQKLYRTGLDPYFAQIIAYR